MGDKDLGQRLDEIAAYFERTKAEADADLAELVKAADSAALERAATEASARAILTQAEGAVVVARARKLAEPTLKSTNAFAVAEAECESARQRHANAKIEADAAREAVYAAAVAGSRRDRAHHEARRKALTEMDPLMSEFICKKLEDVADHLRGYHAIFVEAHRAPMSVQVSVDDWIPEHMAWSSASSSAARGNRSEMLARIRAKLGHLDDDKTLRAVK